MPISIVIEERLIDGDDDTPCVVHVLMVTETNLVPGEISCRFIGFDGYEYRLVQEETS